MDSKTSKENTSMTPFIKEVGKYFMEFLETDFHKRKLPRRSIKLHNDKALLTGINISKYPSFYKVAYKLINSAFTESTFDIQKGVYKADIPKSLLDLIKKQINLVTEKEVKAIIKDVDESIQQAVVKHKDDYIEAYNSVVENTGKIFKDRLVLNLVKSIETSLAKNSLADENAIFQIEEELTDILTNKLTDTLSELVKLLLVGEKVNTKKLLKESLYVDDVHSSLQKFFEMFKVSDLFNDFHELYQNFKIEDKQEFYFYFYDISYKKNKYPIFYIPFSVEREGDTFRVTFDAQLYINKKALTYIVQEYNLEREKKGALKSVAERIIYLADHEKDLNVLLQETLTEITNFFDLDDKLEVAKPSIQTAKNLYVSGSTNIYLSLFDKSDEALLNDYEDILNADEGSSLMSGFEVLIQDFVHKNPESLAKPIRDEWDEKNVDERLVYKSPIPLNSEQRQIISAVNKDNCKYIMVEGPPGTGKSHTITAVVFDTILQNKSVLVLSDKKEALDVVEKNISNTLNKVRVDEKFQNPILRLGKTGNTYSQLLTQSSIDSITQQFRAVKSKYPDLDNQINSAISAMRDGVVNQADAYQQISLEEVNELASLEKHFNEVGFCVDIEEVLNNAESAEELTHIRSILLNLKDKIKIDTGNAFNFDFTTEISDENSENLDEIVSVLEDMKQLSEEYKRLSEEEKLIVLYPLVQENKKNTDKLQNYYDVLSQLSDIFTGNKQYLSLLGKKGKISSIDEIKETAEHTLEVNHVIEKVKYFAADTLASLDLFKESCDGDADDLRKYVKSVKELKGLLGYIGKKDKLEKLKQGFRKRFPLSKFDEPHKHLEEIEAVAGVYDYILELQNNKNSFENTDFTHFTTSIIRDEESYFTNDQLSQIEEILTSLGKSDSVLNSFSNDEFSISILNDLKDLMVVSEIESLYEEFTALLAREKELIEANIDLKKGKNIDILFDKNNLEEIFDEIILCKTYVDTLIEIDDDVAYLKESSDVHKNSFSKAGIDKSSFSTLYENKLTDMSDLEFDKLVRFITLHQDLTLKFEDVKDLSYGERMKQIQNIVTMQMTYLMDERFIDFTNEYKNDAKALKQVIKAKKKFPKEQFSKLKNAFPCMLAGIRDYAEYIPLEPEIFDLVVIDEASQVSIAQAFPALLRAKKVVVLGDNLQFSNVKSALARGDINKHHLANLRDVFSKTVSTEADKVVRLEKFNIKVSILDFFGFINNYQTRLVKHFRGYTELISYSNKFFYKNTLQVMKVRGVPASSVIKFTQVEHDGLEEMTKNTNVPEIEFIISELKEMKERGGKCSVGIITPHTNQQRLLYEKINDLPESDYFFDTLNLKIMTFDTCQGEEMDTIFYSMVATEASDKLNYVFISDLNNVDLDDDEGKIKAQRLNVGLSRAKECMHFVLSKPVDQYTGTAKEFLQHYTNTLLEAQKEPDSSSVDQRSMMEPLVLEWLKQTQFWNDNKDNAEILPQFELGKYLKQLDQTYNHPNYRVDFLLVYFDEEGNEQKIIIEYDGFLEHFGDSMHVVNETNYEEYYSSEDVYRQHVLEGYGYRFIRINKFNLGDSPIETLNTRIQEVVKKNSLITK